MLKETQANLIQMEASAEKADKQLDAHSLLATIEAQNARIEYMRGSKSWKLTKPLRAFNGALHRHVLGFTRTVLIPQHQLERVSVKGAAAWRSSGQDPQFHVYLRNPAAVRGQWVSIEYDFDAQGPTTHQVFFDLGQGYAPDLAITYEAQPGRISQIFYLPQSVRSIRLDPHTAPAEFTLTQPKIKRIPKPEQLLHASATYLPVWRYLEAADCLFFDIQPLANLRRALDEGFQWQALTEDPCFLIWPKKLDLTQPGWYVFDLELKIESRKGVAKFYFDTGNGFSEQDSFAVTYKNNVAVNRIIYLERGAQALRFDPAQEKTRFCIVELRVARLSEKEAETAMLQSILEAKKPAEAASDDAAESVREIIAQRAANASVDISTQIKDEYNALFERAGNATYEEWMETVEAPSLPTPEVVAEELATAVYTPLISVAMPTYNTPENYLRDCIDSVLRQSYPHWELCIADDASSKPHVRRVLKEYETKDARIRVVFRKENGHISAASNSALQIASGEFVVLLDHDDMLSEHALFFVAREIGRNPGAQVIYSDEDKVDKKGHRSDPHFKSDWNPDLFFSQNYVSHLGVYRRDLLKRIGGFRVGVEGSQDQDLLLRCLPHVQSEKIIHIPRVLYHWRTVEGSTALASGEKSYTTEAGIKALKDYFAEHGPKGIQIQAGLVPNTYRVIWPLPEPAPLVSLLIPTRDRKTITELAVRSILDKTTYPNYEIIILDNGSVEPETLEWFAAIGQEDPRVKVIRYDHHFNYSAINNFGVRHAKGSLIGLINNDVEVISPDWLSEMVLHASRKDIGCVGAKLYYSNDTLQHAGIIMSLGGVAGHSHKYFPKDHPGYFHRLVLTQNLSGVTAACLLVRREVYEQVGGFDEDHLKVAFNDVDFCLKVREAGYRNLWTPYAELYHHESISRGTEDTPEKQERFRKEIEFMKSKWGDALKLDPYYSPNLTKDLEDFSIGSK